MRSWPRLRKLRRASMSREHRPAHKPRRRLSLQSLEDRRLLTVDITAFNFALGQFTFTGDRTGANEADLLQLGVSGGLLTHNLLSIGGTGDYASATDFDPTAAVQTIAAGGGTAPTITVNLLGGDDSLTITTNGLIGVHPITYDGGTGSDALSVSGSNVGHTFTLNAAGDGWSGNTTLIAFSNLNILTGSAGNDTVNVRSTATGTNYTVDTGAGDDTINVSSDAPTNNGDLAGILGPLVITGGADNDVLNISDAGRAGASTFLLTNTTLNRTGAAQITYGTLETFNLATGNQATSDDTINIQSTAAGTIYTVNAGAGNDTINVSSDAPANLGNLSGILGALTVNGDAGTDVLNISDAGRAGASTFVLTNTTLDRTGAAQIAYGAVETFNLDAGNQATSDDTINVQSTAAGTVYTVNAGAGDDDINVSSDAPTMAGTLDGVLGPMTLNGGPGTNDVFFSDAGRAVGVTFDLTANTLARTAMGLATYNGFASFRLDAGTGDDTLNVNSTNAASVYSLHTGPGGDSVNVLSLAAGGNTALNTGAGDDTIIVSSTAPGLAGSLDNIQGIFTINGALGTDHAIFSDLGDPDANVYTITNESVFRGGMGDVRHSELEILTLSTSTGNDRVNLRLDVGGPALPTVVQLDGGPGALNLFWVLGTNQNDTVTVGNFVAGTPAQILAGDPVQIQNFASLFMFGFEGDDTFTNNTATPSLLSGGPGTDNLTGGSSGDLIFGGADADHLFGRDGDDQIFLDLDIALDGTISPVAIAPGTGNGGPGLNDIVIASSPAANIIGAEVFQPLGVLDVVSWLTGRPIPPDAVQAIINALPSNPLVQQLAQFSPPPAGLPARVQLPLNPFVAEAYLTLLGRVVTDADPGAQYWTNLAASGLSIEDIRLGFLASAEYFTRAGGTHAGFVAALYRDLLGRAGGTGEIAYWTQLLAQGASRWQIAYGIMHSHEGLNYQVTEIYTKLGLAVPTAGDLNRVAMVADFLAGVPYKFAYDQVQLHAGNYIAASKTYQYVLGLYERVLGRTPTSAELSYWLTELVRGNITQAGLAHTFINSTEHRILAIEALYQQHLGRSADAAGLAHWLGLLGRGGSMADVQLAILSSSEFYSRAGGTDQAFVAQLYVELLGRVGAQAELDYWLGVLASGSRGQVAVAIMASVEFRATVVASWYLRYLHRDPTSAERDRQVAALGAGMPREQVQIGILAAADFRV